MNPKGGSHAHQAKTYGYQERDEELRQQFLEKLAHIEAANMVYVDEVGLADRDDYPYGYSPKGARCYDFALWQEKRQDQER